MIAYDAHMYSGWARNSIARTAIGEWPCCRDIPCFLLASFSMPAAREIVAPAKKRSKRKSVVTDGIVPIPSVTRIVSQSFVCSRTTCSYRHIRVPLMCSSLRSRPIKRRTRRSYYVTAPLRSRGCLRIIPGAGRGCVCALCVMRLCTCDHVTRVHVRKRSPFWDLF